VSDDDDDDGGLQHYEISNDECAACFGQWEDDDDAVEWLCCNNEECGMWSPAECLEKCDDAYICVKPSLHDYVVNYLACRWAKIVSCTQLV